MKILYRPHKSMAELREFDTVYEMLDWIVSNETICGRKMVSKTDINFTYYYFDLGLNCETFIVTVNKYGDENYIEKHQYPMAIGFMTFKY